MSKTQIRQFLADEVIFREGDAGDCAYLIEQGRVLVYLGKNDMEIPLRILGEGDFFGEMSLIDSSPRSASCRAIEAGQLIVISKEQLLDRIQGADPVVRLLMRVLLARLRSQNLLLSGNSCEVPHENAGTDTVTSIDQKEAVRRISLENRISVGLNNDQFIPYYQPIYDLQTGEMRGCEALLRWNTPDRGVVPPSEFMDVMEESSLILRAGQIVIEKAMEDLVLMRSSYSHVKDFFVSINVSGRQFTDPRFLAHLEGARMHCQIPTSQVKLELTERVMTEGPQALSTLQECHALGYQLALDDFGTGFSSLRYLAQMPLADLKIDRSFVMKMLTDDKSLSIIRSLIFMADLLGMKLVAEGIETKEELNMLRSLKVGMGQGYLFSKPLPLADFLKLEERKKTAA
jgi:EAL domain-containing protein (putative c-di-GMP-specific phosphodiesterase class I)